jgi:hypothetical protein
MPVGKDVLTAQKLHGSDPEENWTKMERLRASSADFKSRLAATGQKLFPGIQNCRPIPVFQLS